MLSLSDLQCPGWLQPHHTTEVTHVDGRDDPVCYVGGREQQLLVCNLISLQSMA